MPFWPQLSIYLNVVFIDQRGCGKSDKGEPSKENLNQHGKDVYLFCEALNISKPSAWTKTDLRKKERVAAARSQ